jgi:FkbM family methyltransferase
MQEIEFHRALHRPGTIVDAGAHDGRLTLPLAQLPGSRVVAFEPVPAAFARLRQAVSAAWGGEVPPHVTLRREALAERSGTTTIAAPRINGRSGRRSPRTTRPYVRPIRASRQSKPGRCRCCAWMMPA